MGHRDYLLIAASAVCVLAAFIFAMQHH